MLLYITNLRILPNKKFMNTVMLRKPVTAVMNTAACYNCYITILTNMKIIINKVI